MTDFITFLKTGRLGSLSVGMSNDEVKSLLGEPQDISIKKSPQTWKYGALQLVFYRALDDSNPFLASITVYFHEKTESVPAPLVLSDWAPTAETTFQEFVTYLEVHQIRIFGGVTSGPRKHLVLESAVRVTFDDDLLYSIGFAMKREPETKQLSVKVRRKDFETIEKWARSRGISTSDLCSEWIKEHLIHLENVAGP